MIAENLTEQAPLSDLAPRRQVALHLVDSASPMPPRLAYGIDETAMMLGVCEKTVRRLIARGLLRPSRALRHLLISKKEIERFLEETTQ